MVEEPFGRSGGGGPIDDQPRIPPRWFDSEADQRPEQESAHEITGRAISEGGHRNLLVVAAGVVAIVVALAMLGGLGSGDAPAGAGRADGSLPTLPGFFTTTSSTAAPTTLDPAAVTPTTVPLTTMVPGQFLLGEPTGLWLFYGGADPLQRVDLDTGELIQYGLQAFPLLGTGQDVVVHQAESEVSGWVSAAQPAEQALSWKKGPVAPGPAPDQLWILDRATDLQHPSGEPVGFGRWQLFDTVANRVLDRRPGDLYQEEEARHEGARLVGGRSGVVRPGPDFSTRPDGVYGYGETGYRRIGPGRLLAYDESVLLVGDCADGGDCVYRWVDRATGEPVDDPVPAGPVVFAELLGGGRWLHTIDDGGRSAFLDRRNGRRFDLDVGLSPTISPDGRWLVMFDGDSLTVTDLTRIGQPAVEYQGILRREGGDLLFVEKAL